MERNTNTRVSDGVRDAALTTGTTNPANGSKTELGRPAITVEQIQVLMERIRNTQEGAFAPLSQQPALQALLLPFGGLGGVQLIEYLMSLTISH